MLFKGHVGSGVEFLETRPSLYVLSWLLFGQTFPGKIALLVAVHWVIRDWRLAVMELQAERLQAKLHTRWFNSLEKALKT